MCIICVSKSGVRQPGEAAIRAMFLRNPHGAGYMVARGGRVQIHKGFMDLDDYLRAIRTEHFTASDSVVYHFRISTQAGVNPEMTHPFPLSNQPARLRKLDLRCRVGVAHNGIIRLTSDPDNDQYSDTAIFITQYLSRLIRSRADLRDQRLLDEIFQIAQSKFAIMDGSGYVATVGEFVNDRGLLFSNASYLPWRMR
jgi:predicted glutamine amidotransferase